jgi:hypothetical protein
MLTFAVIGPSGAGKSTLINSLVNERVCPIGVKNTTTKAAAHKFVSDDKISCQIIDTPPDYDPTKLPQCDVLLYLVDIGQGVDSAKWAAFYMCANAINKMRAVPMQIVIVLTKCDSAQVKGPINILIADDGKTAISISPLCDLSPNNGYCDESINEAVTAHIEKYKEFCPVVPFNALGRIRFNNTPIYRRFWETPNQIMASCEGRKAITSWNTVFNVSKFYNREIMTSDTVKLNRIIESANTLFMDIKKYETCEPHGHWGKCNECCKYNPRGWPSSYGLKHIRDNYLGVIDYNIEDYINKPAKHSLYTLGLINGKHCCVLCEQEWGKWPKPCGWNKDLFISQTACAFGAQGCTFAKGHPIGQLGAKLMELYKEASVTTRAEILKFAINGQTEYGKAACYTPQYWNILATHLTFDCLDDIKTMQTKDEAFRLLQFGRNLPIVWRIDVYCAALKMEAEAKNSLRINCINGEYRIFINQPIYSILELPKLLGFNLTQRDAPTISQLFEDLGEPMHYTPELLAQLPEITARINVAPADYKTHGLFK